MQGSPISCQWKKRLKKNKSIKKNAIIIFFVGVDSPSVDCPTLFKRNRRYRLKTGHKRAETAWFSVLSTNWVITQNWKVLSHWPPLIASFYCLLHSVECGQKCFRFHLLPHKTVMWGCQEHKCYNVTAASWELQPLEVSINLVRNNTFQLGFKLVQVHLFSTKPLLTVNL